jgi:hypothetical protein
LAAVVAAPAIPAPAAAAPAAAPVLDESELLVLEFDALVLLAQVDATSDALCRLISLPETVPLIETV